MVVFKIVIRTIGLILIMLLCMLMYSCGSDVGNSTPTDFWFEETSPDGNYSIYCEKYRKALSFSKQRIECSVGKEGRYGVQSWQILIDNKGKELDESNYEIKWEEKRVVITFKGTGQVPVSYIAEWKKAFPDFQKEVEYWENK